MRNPNQAACTVLRHTMINKIIQLSYLLNRFIVFVFAFLGHAEQMSTSRSGGLRGHHHKSEQKTTRVRTVLNEKQLHTLRTCYNANPRPDALMKEQLVEMTGLSPRVIRVWFQNKRCKDKKRSILVKQMQQQQEKVGDISTYFIHSFFVKYTFGMRSSEFNTVFVMFSHRIGLGHSYAIIPFRV